MKPFFTIIIPTLNEEKFVGNLLEDLTKQTFKDFEVIVIDAQSADKTNEIVSGFNNQLKIQFRKTTKRNVSFQRNWGAKIARGNYLSFIDADARITKAYLQKLRTYISKNRGLLFLPSISASTNDPQLNIAIDFANAFVALSQKIGRPFSTGGSMIVEKNFFYLIGGFPENAVLSEDHLLVNMAYKYGVHAKFLSHIRIRFSIRRFQREGKLETLIKYIKSTIHFLIKGKVDKKVIEYEMGGHLYSKESKKAFKDFIRIQPQKLLKMLNSSISTFLKG